MQKLIYVLSLLSLWMVTSVSAQSIKKQEATMEDYIPLLQASGYDVYSFDISEFMDETYQFIFQIKEYVNGEEVKNSDYWGLSNRMMLDEFPEEQKKEVIEKGNAFELAKGVYKCAKKMTIGLIPLKADSIKAVQISLDEMGGFQKRLNLKPLKNPNGKPHYAYDSRPYVIDKFEEDKFIPLVFYASYWMDEQSNFFRFCGAREIGADMGKEYIERTPHYFVIGVVMKKK